MSNPRVIRDYELIRGSINLADPIVAKRLSDDIVEYSETIQRVDEDELRNLGMIFWDLKDVDRVKLWQRLAAGGSKRLDFIRSIHPAVAQPICAAFGTKCGPSGVGMKPKPSAEMQAYIRSGGQP